MLKFEGLTIGNRIRAEDFEPRPGVRESCHVEGVIKAVNRAGTANFPFAHYVIECTRDVHCGQDAPRQFTRVGCEVFVPMESTFDWDSRIQRVDQLRTN